MLEAYSMLCWCYAVLSQLDSNCVALAWHLSSVKKLGYGALCVMLHHPCNAPCDTVCAAAKQGSS